MADPTMVAAQWVLRRLHHIKDQDERYDELIRLRQPMISMGIFMEVLLLEEIETKDAANNPRLAFLKAVLEYHKATKRNERDPGTWLALGARFEKLADATDMVACYKLVYLFLCLRNGGAADELLEATQGEAMGAALRLPEAERLEATGHIYYNVGRWQHAKRNIDAAVALWETAGKQRFGFYRWNKLQKQPYEDVLSSAQQLAKIRKDFKTFFPNEDIDKCGLPADVYEELEREYGAQLHDFSAVPRS